MIFVEKYLDKIKELPETVKQFGGLVTLMTRHILIFFYTK